MPTREEIEEKAYEAQFDYIHKKFGESASNIANYGWGVNETPTHVEIATKVYGFGVLTTTACLATGEIAHNFEGF